MAVAFRDSNAVIYHTSGTATELPMPDTTVAGDRLYVMVGSIASSPVLGTPAGWTKVTEYAPGTALKTGLFARTAQAGDDAATYTWTWSTLGRSFGYAVAFSGVDATAATVATATQVLDTGSASDSPSLALDSGDWLMTVVAGRQNPGTDGAKSWTINDALDVERFDLYSTNTGTGPKLTAAAWDSNRALSPGTVNRAVDPNVTLSQFHIWSVRVAGPDLTPPPPPSGNPWDWTGLPL